MSPTLCNLYGMHNNRSSIFFRVEWTRQRTQLTMIATTVGRIRRSQTVALTVIVDYECDVSCCRPLCPLSFVQLTIVIAYAIMQWLKVRREWMGFCKDMD